MVSALHNIWFAKENDLLTPGIRRYNAMPTEAKNVFDGMDKKNKEIQKSIQDDANKANGASRPAGLSLYVGGALVAIVAGVAVIL